MHLDLSIVNFRVSNKSWNPYSKPHDGITRIFSLLIVANILGERSYLGLLRLNGHFPCLGEAHPRFDSERLVWAGTAR